MGSSARKTSAIERRLKEIEKEAGLVRSDIRTLSRAVKRSDEDIAWGRLKTVARPERLAQAGPVRKDKGRADAEAPVKGEYDLFNWTRRSKIHEAAAHEEAVRAGGGPRTKDRQKGFTPDGRFANYLATGSFSAARPLRQERAVQRNKAVFMVFVVLVVGFVVFKLLF